MDRQLFSDAIVYESDLVRIGAFRCDREYAGFRDTGPAQNDCFVFPRTAVRIEHEDAPAFVASPNIVTFYNRGERYLRHAISERGDRCDWFGIRRDVVCEASRAMKPDVEDEPFRWHRGRSDAKTFFLQRRLFDAVSSGGALNSMAVDETALMLLERVLGGVAAAPVEAKRVELADGVERLLASRFDQPLSLAQIASYAGVSVYHLCRAFRASTGFTIHEYIAQLRLRHGLESVCDTTDSLSRIAVDLGYAHHSHFTSAFRWDFEVTPSKLRASRRHC
jgi:AraC-like DNA-binding protein